MSDNSKLLFTVSRSDLRVEYFRAGGPGGQHQNKTSSACRITHISSGAVGESRQERKQHQNRKIALQRLAESQKFRNWVRMQAAMVAQGYRDVEEKVEYLMRPISLRVEHVLKYTCDGQGCKRQAEVSYLEGSSPALPENWVASEDGSACFCSRCQSRESAT